MPPQISVSEPIDDDKLNELYRYFQTSRREWLPDFERDMAPYLLSVPSPGNRLYLDQGAIAEAQEVLQRLLSSAKVFTENFRLLVGSREVTESLTPYLATSLEFFQKLWALAGSGLIVTRDQWSDGLTDLASKGVITIIPIANTAGASTLIALTGKEDNLSGVAFLIRGLGLDQTGMDYTAGQSVILAAVSELMLNLPVVGSSEEYLGTYATATADERPDGGSASGFNYGGGAGIGL